eukprot:11641933-Alexandrium_andersonii.AAC.1
MGVIPPGQPPHVNYAAHNEPGRAPRKRERTRTGLGRIAASFRESRGPGGEGPTEAAKVAAAHKGAY